MKAIDLFNKDYISHHQKELEIIKKRISDVGTLNLSDKELEYAFESYFDGSYWKKIKETMIDTPPVDEPDILMYFIEWLAEQDSYYFTEQYRYSDP